MKKLLFSFILFLAPFTASAFVIDTGTYTGDATASRNITVGFTPTFCTVTGNNTQASYFTTSTILADKAGSGLDWRGNAATSSSNIITNLTTNAFTIDGGANVNGSGVSYTWWCVSANGDTDFEVGKYTGNGTDDRNITLATITGTPKLVMIKAGNTTDTGAWRTASTTTNNSQAFHEFGAPKTNEIQTFGTGTFQVGTGSTVNTSGKTYYYIAFGPSNGIAEGEYYGNGVDDRNITDPGWVPEATHVKCDCSQNLIWRAESIGADTSAQYSFLAYTGANNIQVQSGSGFQIGTNARVNTAGTQYFWFALRDTPAASSAVVQPTYFEVIDDD